MPRLLEESLGYAAPGGRIVVLGLSPGTRQNPEVIVVKKEIKIVGSRMNCRRFLPHVIEWFEKGQVNPEPLISAVYPFEKIDTAFREYWKIRKVPQGLITY
jgi:L-gulonate 5-dehydrogenase